MIKDQCISVTDLRTKTKECVEGLEQNPKYIFINNRPIAVLMDITEYEENFSKPRLMEIEEYKVTKDLKAEAAKARKLKKQELINI